MKQNMSITLKYRYIIFKIKIYKRTLDNIDILYIYIFEKKKNEEK